MPNKTKFKSTVKSGDFYIHEKRGNPCGKEEEKLYLNYVTFDKCARTVKKWKYKTIQNVDKAILFTNTKTISHLIDGISSGDFSRVNSKAKRKAWVKTIISSQKLYLAVDN